MLEQYRFFTILFSSIATLFCLAAYIFLLQDSLPPEEGMTMMSNGVVMPTYSLFATQGIARILLGSISLFSSICFGFVSIVTFISYIDLKNRS